MMPAALNCCFIIFYATDTDWTEARPPSVRHELEGDLQASEGEVRVHRVERVDERREGLRQPARADHHRRLLPRPLGLDPPHDAVDGLGGPEHHAGSNA